MLWNRSFCEKNHIINPSSWTNMIADLVNDNIAASNLPSEQIFTILHSFPPLNNPGRFSLEIDSSPMSVSVSEFHYSFFLLKNSSFIPSSQVVFHCLNDAFLEMLWTTDRTRHKGRSVSARWGVNGKHNNITEMALETSLNSPRLQFSRRETNWSVQRQENM